MPQYAADTSVSSEKSQQEIQKTLRRYGADQFMMGWSPTSAQIEFIAFERRVRFVLPMPDPKSRQFTHTPERRTPRSASAAEAVYEQAVRQRWRALNLVIKAKLEAVEAKISTFDSEFLAQLVLPNGRTVMDDVGPKVVRAYAENQMPQLLPSYPAIEQSQ